MNPHAQTSAKSIAILLLAVMALATAVIFLRASSLPPTWLSCYRLFLAAFILLPLFFRGIRKHGWRQDFRFCLLPGLALGAHFVSWVVGARSTAVANASLLVNMAPVVLPFLLLVLVGERVTKREIVGTGVALTGVIILTWSDFHVDSDRAYGDLLCLGSMLFLALYYAFGRRNGPRFPDVWLYVVPLYLVAAVTSAVFGLIGGVAPAVPHGRELLYVVALAVIPTILGHALINLSLRHLRGQLVAVVSLCQFVFAGLIEWVLSGRVPPVGFYLACPLALCGAMIVVSRRDKSA